MEQQPSLHPNLRVLRGNNTYIRKTTNALQDGVRCLLDPSVYMILRLRRLHDSGIGLWATAAPGAIRGCR